MKDLFVYESVTSESQFDLWVLQLAANRLTMPYQLGFEILSSVLQACKFAMNYEQVASKHWREFAQLETMGTPSDVLNRKFRRSQILPNVLDCAVAYENNLVRMEFYPAGGGDMLIAKFHYYDCFKLYRHGRAACRTAKAWAGDSARILNFRADLRDAEDNDKIIAY